MITADHAKPAVNELFKKYPFGVAQPGVLITKGDGTKLYSWAIIPTEVQYVVLTEIELILCVLFTPKWKVLQS